MNCKKCGTENLENSSFCKSCGTRIDGKKECPRCHNLNDEDHVFCISCGTRIDGKVACPNCNELLDEDNAFCANCGTKIKSKNDSTSCTKEKKSRLFKEKLNLNLSSKTKSIFKNISFYLGLATILICFLFTFFIGANLNVSESVTSSNIVYSETYIYTFFNTLRYYMSNYTTTLEYYIVAPLTGSILVGLFIILTFISLIFTLKTFIKSLNDESHLNKFIKWCLVSYFIYIGFVVCMSQFIVSSTVFNYADGTVGSVAYKLNEATVAGVTLSSITMLTTLVLYGLNKYKGINKKYIGSSIRTLLILVIGLVGLGLLSSAIVNYTQYLNNSTYSSASMAYGIYDFMAILTNFALTGAYTATNYYSFDHYYIVTLLIIYLIMGLTLLFMVGFILIIKDLLVDFGEEVKKKELIFGIVLGAILIVIGILQLVLINWSYPYFIGESYSYSYTIPITLMVFGVLLIILVITSNALLKVNKENKEVEYVQEA